MDTPHSNAQERYIIHPFLDRIDLCPEPISQGAVSRVFESLCGQYIVKIPYSYTHSQLETPAGKSRWYQLFSHHNDETDTEFHYNQLCSPKPRHFSLSLIRQAERLHKHGQGYKVQIYGLGHYPEDNVEALVMDKYPVISISELPLCDWYRHLPAILYALCEAPHGNLSPENILIDTATGEVRLIDPGSMILDKNFTSYEESDFTCNYTANALYYPLFPPSFYYNRKADMSDPYSTVKLLFIPNPVNTKATNSHEDPDVADSLALGIQLYHKATGVWVFDQFRHDPLWVYEYSSVKQKYVFHNAVDLSEKVTDNGRYIAEIFNTYLNTLIAGCAEPITLNPALSSHENDLIMALLRCEKTLDTILEMLMELK